MSNASFLSFLIGLIISSVSLSAESTSYGLLMIVKGQVTVSNVNAQNLALKVGSKVFPEDTIITGKDSRAKIVMSDRNIINVMPDSKLRIDKYISTAKEKNVSINLLQGKIRNNVEVKYDGAKDKFEVRTPTAIAGVRGTQFVTKYDAKTSTTEIATLHGKVQFQGFDPATNKLTEPVIVRRGEKSDSVGSQPPAPPIKMSPAESKQLQQETAVSKKDDSTTTKNGETTAAAPPPPPPEENKSPAATINSDTKEVVTETQKEISNSPAKVNVVPKQ